jgi:hypothetical protein
VVKWYKVMWSNQGSESDAMWEREDYLREGYKEFYQQWYAFQISGQDFYKGGGLQHLRCLASIFALAFHKLEHHSFMHELIMCETCF